ncbi:MAG: CocE/NonD family hydrolase [Gemmatimonadaceae bacterium]
MRVPSPFSLAGAAALLCGGLHSASLSAQAQAPATGPDEVRAHYAKREVRIRMRDGTELFTAIYTPRDTTRTYPILLMRTPYSVGPYGADAYPASLGPWKAFLDDGYIFVNQDVRGRYMSEGYYSFMTPHLPVKRGPNDVDESTDTYDTIDWVVKNVPRNNGRVGTWGNSAPGFFVAAGLPGAHPALKAAYPSAPMIDWYLGDDRHHNGTLTLAQTYNFISGFDQPREGLVTAYPPRPAASTGDGYAFHLRAGPTNGYSKGLLDGRVAFWDSMMVHPDYDEYWQKRGIWRHIRDIEPAVLTVGGWYDAEDPYGPLRLNQSLEEMSAGTRRTFVMGPWGHGDWNRSDMESFGALKFGSRTGEFFRDSIGFPFFSCLLKDRCGTPLPKVVAFRTGANQWRTFDSWPPADARPRALYLREDGRLSFDQPTTATGADEYVSDPARPVPYTMANSFGYYRLYPIEDQRFASRRPDVLVYETEPLAEDLTVAGPIGVNLHIASTGTDADFIVEVIDVWPDVPPPSRGAPPPAAGAPDPAMDGYQQLVKGDVYRARWRRSLERPEPLVAGQPDSVNYVLHDVFHTFRKGHRLMVHVQSSWFPLIDRNPQKFVPNINAADASDFQAATMTVFRNSARPSRITLGVLP